MGVYGALSPNHAACARLPSATPGVACRIFGRPVCAKCLNPLREQGILSRLCFRRGSKQLSFIRMGPSMRYVLAFFLPPVSIAMCQRWGHFIFNLIFWLISLPLILFVGVGLIGWLLCTIHALIVCRVSSIDKRVDRMAAAIQSRSVPPPINRV